MKKIIGLVGTSSDYSTNRLLLQFMASHFKQEVEMELIEIKDIPMFNKPASTELPQIVQDIADKIDEADGVVISTPEYDHAIPAVLMNALNWLSYGIFPFVDKPVMITGASYGVLGSSRAQSHLRQMLNSPELKARTMPGIEFLLSHSLQAFDDEGNLKEDEQITLLEDNFKDFLMFIDLMAPLNHAHEINKKQAENFSWEDL